MGPAGRRKQLLASTVCAGLAVALVLGAGRARADVVATIHDIQGSGNVSPLNGSAVTTTGIVTAVKANGFFMQAPDFEADPDPQTSEGIFVFTGSAPPTAASVGNRVQVSATVSEFVTSSDPFARR